jgi:hypothetical protein
MSYASDFGLEMYAYVDPASGEVKSLFVETAIGLTYRVDEDWQAPDSQAQVDELTSGLDCYKLNWDKNMDEVPEDVPDDYEDEHEAVYEFDNGQLNIGNVLKYFDLAYKAGEGISQEEE